MSFFKNYYLYNNNNFICKYTASRKDIKEVFCNVVKACLKLQSLTLLLLLTTQFEMLTSLQSQLSLGLASNTFQSQNNLLGSLSFLVENWLGLTTETGLFTVITSLTLSVQGSLTSLVLGDLVLGVLTTVLTFAESLSGLWNVNCKRNRLVQVLRNLAYSEHRKSIVVYAFMKSTVLLLFFFFALGLNEDFAFKPRLYESFITGVDAFLLTAVCVSDEGTSSKLFSNESTHSLPHKLSINHFLKIDLSTVSHFSNFLPLSVNLNTLFAFLCAHSADPFIFCIL